ncbi:MAG: ABC transporter ATP-binding protein [Tissierellia bacterium]|nr:ABC transporter ATP-binding protein [Tissierellia bacterium]
MIEIINVTKKFGEFKAVDEVNLKIDKGSFIGLLGPNGAGKTTLIRIIIGLGKPTEGQVQIGGERVGRNNDNLKKKIGIVPQHTNLDKELTVYENLVFAAKLFKMKKKDYVPRIEELLKFLELEDSKCKEARNLSGGMQRKLMIGKALLNDPDIILLDEPTVGVDINGRRKIWDILKAMKTNKKIVMLTTHYIEEADYLCDKVCFMDSGKIFENDSPCTLKKQLGDYTVEYFDNQLKTNYRQFNTREEANIFIKSIEGFNYILRETTLEDVFYSFTNRRVV